MLRLKGIQIAFKERVIEDGALTAPSGKLTALTGPSGSGKTTLLYCAGLISSNSDYEYELNGKHVDLWSEQEKGEIRKTKIGYVFQENNLNTRLTVRENIRLSAALGGADTGDARMEELLRQVGLEGRGKEWPNTLSGGEQQRAALACALAKEPELILADEPTSSLDEANTMEILSLLKAAAKAGKTVIIATHSPVVLEQCEVVYEIRDKKAVLIKGVAEEPEEAEQKEEKAQRKTGGFELNLRYLRKSARKGQVLKYLTVIVCAASIAVTALSAGYVRDFSERQKEHYQAVSARELVAVRRFDPRFPSTGYYNSDSVSLTEDEISQLQSIEHVEAFAPVVVFNNSSDFTMEEMQIDYDQPLPVGIFNTYISFENATGKSGTVGFCNVSVEGSDGEALYDPGENILYGNYSVGSYFSYEGMDLKCSAIDESVAPDTGLYLPLQVMDTLGLTEEDLDGLVLTIDVAIPSIRMVDDSEVTTDQGETFNRKQSHDWCVVAQITLPVRGVLQTDAIAVMFGAMLFAPANVMLDYMDEYHMDEIPDIYYEKYPEDINYYDTIHDWRPWAYYLRVDDVANIDAVKAEIAKIAPDIDVVQEYQDYHAVTESTENTQNVALYISLAVLVVVFCLSAIVYVNIIDRRKYEFAMLRANGMTRKEVWKLVMTEMVLQAVATFVVSLILAYGTYAVASRIVEGFFFGADTLLWLLLISIGSVVLPSVISLVLTNKYEPDVIMRN